MSKDKKDVRHKTYVVQFSQYYETHDDEGNLFNPDITFFTDCADAQNSQRWKDWRIHQLNNSLEFDFSTPKSSLPTGVKKAHYIGIMHDQDTRINKNTGNLEPKPPHIHIVITFDTALTESAANKFLQTSRPENLSPVHSVAGALRYLCHITEQAIKDGKHIYDENCLFGNYPTTERLKDYFHAKINRQTGGNSDNQSPQKQAVEQLTNKLGAEIENGNKNMLEAEREFKAHFAGKATAAWPTAKRALQTALDDYLAEKADDYRLNGRNLQTVFITGKGGAGKTRIAESMAYYADIHHSWFAASAPGKRKTTDFTDGYSGQPQAIINEVEGFMESFRAWCSLLDPYSYAPVSSRNRNTDFVVDRIFMTSSKTMTDFILSAVCQDFEWPQILQGRLQRFEFEPYELALFNWLKNNDFATFDSFSEKLKGFNVINNDNDLITLSDNAYQLLRRLGFYVEVFKPREWSDVQLLQNKRIDRFPIEQRFQAQYSLADFGTILNNHNPFESDVIPANDFLTIQPQIAFNHGSTEPHILLNDCADLGELAMTNISLNSGPIFSDGNPREQTIYAVSKFDSKIGRHVTGFAVGIDDVTNKKEIETAGKILDAGIGMLADDEK